MSNETENRRRLFSKGDLFWFLLLPLLMGVGYFGFRYYQNTNADPNLRLVAKFNDNVSVELKGIAFGSAIGKPGNRWWKPNGLDFPEFKPDPSMFGATTTQSIERVFVFEIQDTSETQPRFRIQRKDPSGIKSGSITSYQGSLMFHFCPVYEGYFPSNDFTIELATRGTQTIAHLTPEKTSTEVSVSGMSLRFEVIDSADRKEWEIALKGPRRATELALLSQIDCKFSRGDTKAPAFMRRGMRFNKNRDGEEFRWAFPKSDWTEIEITFIDYDQIVEFDGVSVNPGVITSPHVEQVQPSQK